MALATRHLSGGLQLIEGPCRCWRPALHLAIDLIATDVDEAQPRVQLAGWIECVHMDRYCFAANPGLLQHGAEQCGAYALRALRGQQRDLGYPQFSGQRVEIETANGV